MLFRSSLCSSAVCFSCDMVAFYHGQGQQDHQLAWAGVLFWCSSTIWWSFLPRPAGPSAGLCRCVVLVQQHDMVVFYQGQGQQGHADRHGSPARAAWSLPSGIADRSGDTPGICPSRPQTRDTGYVWFCLGCCIFRWGQTKAKTKAPDSCKL